MTHCLVASTIIKRQIRDQRQFVILFFYYLLDKFFKCSPEAGCLCIDRCLGLDKYVDIQIER